MIWHDMIWYMILYFLHYIIVYHIILCTFFYPDDSLWSFSFFGCGFFRVNGNQQTSTQPLRGTGPGVLYSLGNSIILTAGFRLLAEKREATLSAVEKHKGWVSSKNNFDLRHQIHPGAVATDWWVDQRGSQTKALCTFAFALETLNSYHPSLIFFIFFWQPAKLLMCGHTWWHTWVM